MFSRQGLEPYYDGGFDPYDSKPPAVDMTEDVNVLPAGLEPYYDDGFDLNDSKPPAVDMAEDVDVLLAGLEPASITGNQDDNWINEFAEIYSDTGSIDFDTSVDKGKSFADVNDNMSLLLLVRQNTTLFSRDLLVDSKVNQAMNQILRALNYISLFEFE